ncbi:MAG: efflux RND transporter permease subunit, partial [Planctomycetota bacterium]|nr:efflux RND transporter permease subunit [Planctomycetota bacterium]
MSLSRFALSHRTVIMVAVLLIMGTGLYNFATMSRREDPEILIRDCIVMTSWPGAPATKIEELVSDPLELAIGEIDEVKEIKSVSRVGLSLITVTLEDAVKAPDQLWDEVRAKVARVEPSLPQGVRTPVVNSDFGDVYVTCFALYQTPPPGRTAIDRRYTPREMEILAETIEDQLKTIDAVAKVDFWGVQDERIYVEVDSADWAKLDLTLADLQNLFEARNIVAPGGQVDTEKAAFAVTPTGEFTSVAQMNELVVKRLDGTVPVRIADLPLTIERRYVEPPTTVTRLTTRDAGGTPCLVVGVAMKAGNNVVQMDTDIDTALDALRATSLPPDIALQRVNDVPRQVSTLISDFTSNLAQAIVLVLGVALLMMGWRPALIMATAVPLSMVAAFAVVRLFGVELEQFSIASLIIALGMVVDNAIVVSDNAVRLLREGKSRLEAAIAGAQGLAVPILTSTLTTVCAFLPMLTLPGSPGEYIRSLPVVVAATLGASYFVAMLVTPLMCFWILKPKPKTTPKQTGRPALYDRAILWCLNHKLVVIGVAVLAFAGSQVLGTFIGSQFFPGGERDQFFIHVWLP